MNTQSHTHTQTQSHKHSKTQSHTHTQRQSNTHPNTITHTLKHTHTHTNKHMGNCQYDQNMRNMVGKWIGSIKTKATWGFKRFGYKTSQYLIGVSKHAFAVESNFGEFELIPNMIEDGSRLIFNWFQICWALILLVFVSQVSAN